MVRTCVRTYVAFRNAPAQVQQPGLFYIFNRVSNLYIACKYIVKSDYGYCLAAHESTYQDCCYYINQDNEYSLIHTQCAALKLLTLSSGQLDRMLKELAMVLSRSIYELKLKQPTRL